MITDRRELRRRLYNDLAAEQSGYFTASQAAGIGYSHQAQAHHVHAGNWLRVDRGLFRLAEWIPGINDDLSRWTLWSKGRGVISHETALAVYDIGEFESPYVNLTVPPAFRMSDDAVRLHRAVLPDIDVAQRTGFRVTTAAYGIEEKTGWTSWTRGWRNRGKPATVGRPAYLLTWCFAAPPA